MCWPTTRTIGNKSLGKDSFQRYRKKEEKIELIDKLANFEIRDLSALC